MKNQVYRLINRIIKYFCITHLKSSSGVVYLTFDDGPEPGITEFIIDELEKHNFKATFFCKGENVETYPYLIESLIEKKQGLGNHTYSHINSFTTPTNEYINDVERCERLINTHLFRPPWGYIKLNSWLKLRKKYKIIFWGITSGDTDSESFDLTHSFTQLTNETRPGSIVLFHFCKLHENETRQLLPPYLNWLSQNKFTTELIQ